MIFWLGGGGTRTYILFLTKALNSCCINSNQDGDARARLTKVGSILILSTLVGIKVFGLWILCLALVIIGWLFIGKGICDLEAHVEKGMTQEIT